MEAVLFKTAPFSNKFYGALERQVQDQIQHRHCDHVTRLHHRYHQKRYIAMVDREQELYFD